MNLKKLSLVFCVLLSANAVLAKEPVNLTLAFNRVIFKDPSIEITTSQLITHQRDVENARNEANKKVNVPCTIIVNKPSDQRFNQDNFGSNHQDEPITTEQSVADWLENALIGMKTLGHKTTLDSKNIQENDIILSTALKKMYVWNFNIMKFGTIGVETTITYPKSSKSFKKFYRISGYHGNSYDIAINNAANRLIEKVSDNLEETCMSN